MQIVVISVHDIRICAQSFSLSVQAISYAGSEEESMFTPFALAVSITSCATSTPSASIMQAVSASEATARMFMLDIIVIQALSA